jgi:hypothetical protein
MGLCRFYSSMASQSVRGRKYGIDGMVHKHSQETGGKTFKKINSDWLTLSYQSKPIRANSVRKAAIFHSKTR